MRELSLFTGAGGGVYGSKLLGWQTLGYVEWEDYPQRVIAQRIKDGIFDEAPIFTDVREFVQSGAARAYRGFVDVVSAGFPCQGFSQAGKGLAGKDPRNQWPATREVLREVEPELAWLENVPALLNHKYGQRILAELAEIFPNIRGACIGNNELGQGVCNSERLWILASKTNSAMLEGLDFQKYQITNPQESFRRQHSRAISEMLSQDDYTKLKRNSNAVADGKHRLKAIGNGQVPLTMACAYEILSGGVTK